MMVLLQVIPLGFVFEDDTLVEASDSLVEPHLRHPPCNSVLDVNRLLDSVCMRTQVDKYPCVLVL